jgi:hypothetical protein
MANLILYGLLAILGWSVFVLISPYRGVAGAKQDGRAAQLLALQGQARCPPFRRAAGPQDQARDHAGLDRTRVVAVTCSGLHCAGCAGGAAVPVVPLAVCLGAAWLTEHIIEVAIVSAAVSP